MNSKILWILWILCTESLLQFTGNFTDYSYVKQWLTDKCIPLVREVTFENVEELTEEGLPFLLFFRNPSDKEGDKKFTELVNCISWYFGKWRNFGFLDYYKFE